MKKWITLSILLTSFLQTVLPNPVQNIPSTPASNLKVTGTDGDKVTVSWSNGDGARRIVIARKDAPVTAVPVNGVNYAASNLFGNGNQPADGEFVIYNGTGASVNLAGLQPSSTYHFAIYEYNGTGSSIEYLAVAATVSGSTFSAPVSQPENVVIDNIDGHSMRVSWNNTVGGDGSGRIILVREGSPVNVNPVDITNYTANLSFGSGTQIGSGNYVVYKTNGAQATVTNLQPGTVYYFALFEYKGSTGLVFNINNPPTASATTLPRPSQPATAFNFSGVEGNSMTVSVAKGNGSGRVIIARDGAPVTAIPSDGITYAASPTFGSGQEIAPGEFVIGSGTTTSLVFNNLSIGHHYYFASYELDGTGSRTTYLVNPFLSGDRATATQPQLAAHDLTISNVTNSAFTASWQNGDGQKRLVVVHRSDYAAGTPADLSHYSASSIFQYGSNVGPNNYAVYANTGSSVTVTGLTGGYSYVVTVYEYNGNNAPVYLLDGAPSATVATALAPSQPASTLQFTNIEGNRITASWQNGNGNRRLVIAKAGSPVTAQPQDNTSYTASSIFGSGDELAPGEFVVYNNASPSFVLANLQPGTTYYLAVFEYNSISGINYYLTSSFASGSQSTVSVPSLGATNLGFPGVKGNSLQLNWTKGNGGNRLVIARAGSAVTNIPADFHSYSANSVFGYGDQVGAGNYVVYNGNGSAATVTGLDPGVTYYFTILEYNGAAYPVYGSSLLTGSQATNERPTIASTGINFLQWEGNKVTVKWTSGNGGGRIMIVRQGAPVTAKPADGITYPADGSFGSGTEIAPGEFVVYDNNFNEMQLAGLQQSTTYYFAIFEYDGSGSDRRYLQTPYLEGSGTTITAPTQQASNVLFSSVGSTTVNVNWTSGNGERYLLVARKGAPVDALPQDLQMYSASYQFGKSVFQNDIYTLYAGAGTNASITTLSPGTTYYFAVFAYNGFSGPVYNTGSPATGQVTTIGPPADPAQTIVFANTGNSQSVRIAWDNGSGQQRLVLVKEGSPVDAVPEDNTSYSANSFLGGGDQIGSGNFVVYRGASNQVTISNLEAGKNYYVSVFEFNQFTTGPLYLTANPPVAVFSGFALPVTLVSFQGESAGNGNMLHWSTASESNTRRFVVERSTDAGNFNAIGEVAAAGNNSVVRNYGFTDGAPLGTSYYRLRMEDLDGRFTYSEVIRLNRQAGVATGLRLYPTIATDQITLVLDRSASGAGSWQMVGSDGKVYQSGNINWPAGGARRQLRVDRLPAGVYFLVWTYQQEKHTMRFIKQ